MHEEQLPYDPADLASIQPRIFICGPGPGHYRVFTHRRGAKKWQPFGGKYGTEYEAATAMARVFTLDSHWPEINKAVVVMVENEPGYYDPVRVAELRR